MAKTTGLVYKEFMKDEKYWGSHICDDVYLLVDGEEYEEDELLIKDEATVKIEGGVVYQDDSMERELCSYSLFFKRWLNLQSKASVIVTVPKEALDELKEFIKKKGGTIR